MFADSRLCIVRCDDGSQYMVRCCLRGQVVEVNGSLVTKPELITQKVTVYFFYISNDLRISDCYI